MKQIYNCILTVLSAIGWLTGVADAGAQQKPHIVIIVADDLGWGDVGFHGSNIRTPNLDKLAGEGVVLDNFYTTPICSPTRAGLMTGRYPDRFGLRRNVIAPWLPFGVDTSEVFLSDMLARAGYTNRAALGKWHLGHARRMYLPLQRGFTHFYGAYNGAVDYFTHQREGELDWHRNEESAYDKGYTTDLITAEAVNCIQQYAGEQAPFFIYVAYNAPHGPLQAKEEDLKAYGFDPGKPLFNNRQGPGSKGRGNTKWQTYAAMVTSMDAGIGAILKALEEQGIADNTLVLFFSDNGAETAQGGSSGELRGAKFQEWEGGVRSPAVIRWPAGFGGGRKEGQVTGYIDIFPTIGDITGLTGQSGKPLDGISILPVLQGKTSLIPRDFYLGFGALIADNRWKLVRSNTGNPKMDHQEDLLFDIRSDPREQRDLKTQHPELHRELVQKVSVYDAIKPTVAVPPYGEGKDTFKAPREWKITD